MRRDIGIGTALVVLGVVLFVGLALFPVQPVLVHDTGPNTFDSPDELREEGVEIISYGSLSERGQALYVRTLEAGGTHQVAPGEGAPDFGYLTREELAAAWDRNQNPRPGRVVIERPAEADLPPADEPFDRGTAEQDQRDQRQQQVQRYDLIQTSTEPPSLGSVPQLLRLAAALLAVCSLGIGGYLRSLP